MTPNLLDELEGAREAYRAGFIEACKWPAPVTQDADSPAFEREFQKWNNEVRTHAPAHADMAKRLEAAERDAARYRWLRMNCVDHWEDKMSGEPRGCSFNFEGPTHDVDADIDAAIDATQEGEG